MKPERHPQELNNIRDDLRVSEEFLAASGIFNRACIFLQLSYILSASSTVNGVAYLSLPAMILQGVYTSMAPISKCSMLLSDVSSSTLLHRATDATESLDQDSVNAGLLHRRSECFILIPADDVYC